MSVGVLRREIIVKNGRNRKPRPKTFKTEDAAKAYAAKEGLKDFVIQNLRNEVSTKNKYRIVSKN
ncbi:hypothetical protein JXM83_06590 [Candidatus Woesearchaeota archaeon]|nr:hypothetical protein [Candidatus Woesearchaeota archaeon]